MFVSFLVHWHFGPCVEENSFQCSRSTLHLLMDADLCLEAVQIKLFCLIIIMWKFPVQMYIQMYLFEHFKSRQNRW